MSNLEHRRNVFRKAVVADDVLSSRFCKRERAIAGMCGRASIANGHSVTGLTRTPPKAVLLQKLGATPVVANALGQRAIHAAVAAARPDVIALELTDLAGALDLRKSERAFASSNRLRSIGTDHLLAAARACGVNRIVAQSYCGWPYARTGGYVKSEDNPLDPNPRQEQRRALSAFWKTQSLLEQPLVPIFRRSFE